MDDKHDKFTEDLIDLVANSNISTIDACHVMLLTVSEIVSTTTALSQGVEKGEYDKFRESETCRKLELDSINLFIGSIIDRAKLSNKDG